MSGHQTQIEKLTAEKALLKERIEKLEADIAKREYRQGLKERVFWGHAPNLWFSIVEAEFKVAGVLDDFTKYNYVISQLNEEVSEKVKHIIRNPPHSFRYPKIKEELIRLYEEPEYERMRRLFNETLEGKTPSQLYTRLRNTAGTAITVEKFLLHLWLRCLPKRCQEILVTRLDQTNLKLVELADNIMEATKVSRDLRKITVMDNIQQCVDELSKEVVALQVAVKRESRSRSTSKSPSQTATPTAPKPCWYHMRWGADAYRCIPPCNWKKTEKTEE